MTYTAWVMRPAEPFNRASLFRTANAFRLAAFLLPSAFIGCATPNAPETRIRTLLDQQARDWNDGDIDAFMQAYWNSDDLTFSAGGRTTRGWDATRERYQLRYPDRAAMGTLTFSDLQVTPLNPDAALVLGRWHLARQDDTLGGNFSLVFRRIEGRWRIIHDHTSSDMQEQK